MEIFRSGRWSVNQNGIAWHGSPAFFMDKDSVGERGSGSRSKMYDALVRMTEKSWLTKDDMYTLNTAYIFALEYFNKGFSSDISFDDTLLEQKRLLDQKGEEIHVEENDETTMGGGD